MQLTFSELPLREADLLSKKVSLSSGYSTENGQMATGGDAHLESFRHIVESDCENANAQFENTSPSDMCITRI